MKDIPLPSEAVYAFMSWLTVRESESGPFGANNLVGDAPELIDRFCKWQGWESPRANWIDNIRTYERD